MRMSKTNGLVIMSNKECVMQQEQSVAEILSSIRQVLSREAATLNTTNTTQIQPVRDDVYELTPQMQLSAGRLVTPQTEMKTQAALEQLNALKPVHSTTQDQVEQSLRPFLQDWLNKNLPDIVERIVREEVQRIINKS